VIPDSCVTSCEDVSQALTATQKQQYNREVFDKLLLTLRTIAHQRGTVTASCSVALPCAQLITGLPSDVVTAEDSQARSGTAVILYTTGITRICIEMLLCCRSQV
jgi:hypothetical protein